MNTRLILITIIFCCLFTNSICLFDSILSLFTYTWTITPNDIDREIKVWEDRKEGKLKNCWDFIAINYDADQIINVLKYAKSFKDKSVIITCRNFFWKAEVIYTNK